MVSARDRSIWQTPISINDLNRKSKGTLAESLSIEFVDFGEDWLTAKMPVNEKTRQPAGILHGGASVALAETVASVAALMAAEPKSTCVGLEINANHIKKIASGWVFATATPIHIGRSTQVWAIDIRNMNHERISCCRMTAATFETPNRELRQSQFEA